MRSSHSIFREAIASGLMVIGILLFLQNLFPHMAILRVFWPLFFAILAILLLYVQFEQPRQSRFWLFIFIGYLVLAYSIYSIINVLTGLLNSAHYAYIHPLIFGGSLGMSLFHARLPRSMVWLSLLLLFVSGLFYLSYSSYHLYVLPIVMIAIGAYAIVTSWLDRSRRRTSHRPTENPS